MKNNYTKGLPTLQEAKMLLEEAGKLNPGPWIKHSMYAGNAAKIIAEIMFLKIILKCYSDEKALSLFNSDNCHGDDFLYTKIKRMNEAVDIL